MATDNNNKILNLPNKGNVPRLRFVGYTDEWKNVKIADIATIVGGGTPDTTISEYWDGDIQWFTPSEIGKSKYIAKSDRTITNEGLINSSAKILPKGTILLSTRATIGECSIANQECCTNQGFQSIIAKNNTINEFQYYLIQTKKKDLIRNACGSTFLEISANEVRKIRCNIPNIEEQRKIADFLYLLDKRIETQTKIIQQLQSLKVAICNKYLIKGNSLKLDDIGYFVRGLSYSASDVVQGNGTAVIRSNNIINGDLLNFNDLVYVDKKSTKEQQLKSGDIVICMANGSSALVGKASYYNGSFDEDITIGAFCGIYRSSNPVVRWLFQSSHYRKCILKNIQGGNGAIANVYPEDILNISFKVTTDLHYISNLLQQIEDKITKENCLLNNYSQTKLYLLRNMFI